MVLNYHNQEIFIAFLACVLRIRRAKPPVGIALTRFQTGGGTVGEGVTVLLFSGGSVMQEFLGELQGQKGIITGGGHGIGKSIALEFANEGAQVAVADINGSAARLTCEEICSRHGPDSATWVQFDQGQESDCNELADRVVHDFGAINYLVVNAATWSGKRYWHPNPQCRSSWQEWERVFAVNVAGPLQLVRNCAGEMLGQAGIGSSNSITVVTSIHQSLIRRLNVEYSLTKASQRMLVNELAAEFAFGGVRVNAIAPGDIETSDDSLRKANPFVPLRGVAGRCVDIARVAVFLTSKRCSGYVTGTCIEVDGGLHLHNHCLSIMPSGSGRIVGGSARPESPEESFVPRLVNE